MTVLVVYEIDCGVLQFRMIARTDTVNMVSPIMQLEPDEWVGLVNPELIFSDHVDVFTGNEFCTIIAAKMKYGSLEEL